MFQVPVARIAQERQLSHATRRHTRSLGHTVIMRMMFGLVVRFEVRQDAQDDFDQLVAEFVPKIGTKEPGTLLYLCHRVQGAPGARVFYELYRNDEAFQAHEVAPHVKDFHARRKPMMAGPERVEFLDRLDGKGWPAE